MSRLFVICPDCRREIDDQHDGTYLLCPVCAVPMREDVRTEEESTGLMSTGEQTKILSSILRIAG